MRFMSQLQFVQLSQQIKCFEIKLLVINPFPKIMNSKYKIMKSHGFNPFRSKWLRELNQLMQRNGNKQQKLTTQSRLNMKEIGLILHKEDQMDQETSKNSKSIVTQNYQLHAINHAQNPSNKPTIAMFNEREYCQKAFDVVFAQDQLQRKQNDFNKQILEIQQVKYGQQNSRLIIYLANSRQTSQKVILGHNQTQNLHQSKNHSNSLLSAVYQRLLKQKGPQKQGKTSHIYFSAIGIEKENNLYDLLNEQHLNNDFSLVNKVPQIKVRKITCDQDSVIAENLKKQIVNDQNHLNKLIEKFKEIRNHIQFYQNYNQAFLIGELYHFYQADENYDILNQCVILKINQHFPQLSAQTLTDGFYQRRIKQSNSSRISSLILRIGLNIKACRKNKIQQKQTLLVSRKSSQIQRHQSKILLYLGPIFMNLDMNYTLINQIGSGSTISQEINKFELNRSFRPEKNPNNLKLAAFYHTKHYLDLPDVKEIVRKSAIKFTLQNFQKSESRTNKPGSRMSHNSSTKRRNQPQVQEQDLPDELKYLQSMKHKKFSHTQTHRTFQTDKNRQKSTLKQGQRIKSKSFFCSTISSSQRNYWKSKDRQNKKHSQLTDIGTLLGNESDIQTINMKGESMKFIDEKTILGKSLQGVRITYKRKLVVRKFEKGEQMFGNISEKY